MSCFCLTVREEAAFAPNTYCGIGSSAVLFIWDCQEGSARYKRALKINIPITEQCDFKLKNFYVIFTRYLLLCSCDNLHLSSNICNLKFKISPKNLSSPFFKIKRGLISAIRK